jgi:hypothetical protein
MVWTLVPVGSKKKKDSGVCKAPPLVTSSMIDVKLVCHVYSVVVSSSMATDGGIPVAKQMIS